MREEYRNKTPDNGDFWREKMAALEHSGDDSDVTGSADEGSTSGSSEDEDKGPFTDEFLTYHAAIRAIDMARIQIQKLHAISLKIIEIACKGIPFKGMKQLVSKAKSLQRETIFIFTSDNGAITWFNWSWTSGQRERTGCNYPYKGLGPPLGN